MDDGAMALLASFAEPRPLSLTDLIAKPATLEGQVIRELVWRGFLVPANTPTAGPHSGAVSEERPPAPPGGIKVVQLVVVNACNFGCTYCFEGIQKSHAEVGRSAARGELPRGVGDGVSTINLKNSVYVGKRRQVAQHSGSNKLMRVEDAVAYVGNAIRLVTAAGEPELMIQFFGGEPLLNWRAIRAVMQAYGRGDRYGIRIGYSIVTNGSLITPEIADSMAQHEVAVCVSFDSPKSDSRRLTDGGDSRPLVAEGLKHLVRSGNRIALNAALSSETWEHCDESLVEFAASLGIAEIGVVLDLDPGFYERIGAAAIVTRLWRLVTAGREQGVIVTGYWHQIYQLMAGFDSVQSRGFKMCSAKGRQLSIEPDGSVFSCKGASGYFGNIAEGDRLLHSDTYRAHVNLAFENPVECRGCEIESFCSGFCLGPLEKKHGRIDVVESSACEVYRGITRRLIQQFASHDVPSFSCPARMSDA